MGAIKRCLPCAGQFVSKIFLAKKPNGKKRFILNLKELNKHVFAPHFKMEDARAASRLLQYGNYAATLDLKDAYYLLPIHKDHRKYLRFLFKGFLYEFSCLPFGLASAPYTFTKLMKPIVARLRCNGVTCINYLDDFFILGSSKEECSRNVELVASLLTYLGFIINKQKSSISPETTCRFLGFVFNSIQMSVELPPEKKEKILKWIRFFMSRKKCKISQFAQLLGLLNSACPAVKYGRLYTKVCERAKYLSLQSNKGNYNCFMPISNQVKVELDWWYKNIPFSKNDLKRDEFTLEICTDASLSGWGAFCKNESTYGWWSTNDKRNHINYLELQAIFFGLKCFANKFNNCNVLIRTDNTTALAYVNNMGSVQHPKLNDLAGEIWRWCEARRLWILASYISSGENWQADQASRILPAETEWSLNNNIFNCIVQNLGKPNIDLFASVNNHKCDRYVSWLRDPGAEAVDAFTIKWHNLKFYAFPPFSLVLRVIQKIINDQATGILVVPFWQSQAWYPLYFKLIIGKPLFFGPQDNILLCPFSKKAHPLSRSLILVAARLSGKLFRKKEYLATPWKQWKNH